MAWRFVDLSKLELPELFGIEEAIAKHGENTVMLWVVKSPTASIGFFQRVEQELDIRACKELGVRICRRSCGGGAVYFDDRQLYYSVIERHPQQVIPSDVFESFRKVCSGLVYALRRLGIEAEFSGKNDVVVKGKKISGNAQTRRWGAYIVHGTLLYDFDFETASRILRIPAEKFRDKGISLLSERIATIKQLLPEASAEDVKLAMRRGFEEALGVELRTAKLSEEELRFAREYEKRYFSDDWNFMR